jgi:formate hydrogenlyase transcriptional activator
MDALVNWDWPGNIRELEKLIERAVILTSRDKLTAPIGELRSSRVPVAPLLTFRDSERNAIIHALKAAKGRISGREGAAQRLGLKRTKLHTKMGRLGVAGSAYRG